MGSAKVVFLPYLCFVIMFVISFGVSEAKEYPVGGHRSLWKIPSKPDGLENWASKMRFLPGDSLLIKYDPKADSVLQVTEENYKTCNTSNPIKAYNDGNTRIALDHSGKYYFISGAEGHCEKGQKMRVWVLSEKHSHPGHDHPVAPANPPAQSPAPVHAPAPAPSNGAGRVKVGALVVVSCLVGLVLG